MLGLPASVGVPLWGAALFFCAIAASGLALHAYRLMRAGRRRRAGLVEPESGWYRAAAHVSEGGRYVCAAVREGGAIVEIWDSRRPDDPLPPPRDARPFAAREPEKPIAEAISRGLSRPDAEGLVLRTIGSAEGT
jgi:hypothetical protein